MKVFLLQNVSGIGKAGELVEVKDGFAKNALLPKGQAVLPGSQSAQRFVLDMKRGQIERDRQEKMYKEKAALLNGRKYTISVKVGDNGKVFGSVTKNDLTKLVGVNKDQIILDGQIKSLGNHEIGLDFGNNIRSRIIIEVVPHS